MVREKKAEETTSGGQIVLCTQETYLQKCDEIIQLKSSILKVRFLIHTNLKRQKLI